MLDEPKAQDSESTETHRELMVEEIAEIDPGAVAGLHEESAADESRTESAKTEKLAEGSLSETIHDLEELDELEVVDPIEQLIQQVEDQAQRVEQAARAVAIRRQRQVTNREKRDRIRQDLAHLTSARDSLGSWLHERSQSLGLKLLDFVSNQEELLRNEERAIRAWCEMPLPSTVDSAARLRKTYVRNIWLSIFSSALVPVFLYALDRATQEWGFRVPWFEDVWWRYVILGAGLLLIFVVLSLAAYHRGYMQMKSQMDKNLSRGRYLLGAIQHLRTERARIEGLMPQLRERLQFYGAILQEPWRVPGLGAGIEGHDDLNAGLPALLQIAKTAHANDPAVIKLRAQFIAEQYQIGMRRKAIDDLIKAAADSKGIPREQADLSVVDRDSASYGLRSALHEMVRDPQVLEIVGRSRVAEIAAHIQSGMAPSGERPGIARTNVDTLQGLSVKHDLLAQWSGRQISWDDYVSEILEDGAALSRLAFSPLGTAQSRHLKFQSIAVAPERLQDRAGSLVEFVEMSGGTVTGTEIIARIDITPPMDVSEVALFENQLNTRWDQQESSKSGNPSDDYDDSYTL